jgi:hypothetical protein
MSVAWVLPADHVTLPVASFTRDYLHVFRLAEPEASRPVRLNLIIRWDQRRAARRSGDRVPEQHVLDLRDLVPLLESFEVVATSGSRSLAAALAARMGRTVIWLSSNGHPATAHNATWSRWLANEPTLTLEARHIQTDGSEHPAGYVECRRTLTSPAVTQQQLLEAAHGMLVRPSRFVGTRPIAAASPLASTAMLKPPPGPLRLAAEIVHRTLLARLRGPRSGRDHWTIAVGDATDIPDVAGPVSIARPMHWWPTGSHRFIADPCLTQVGTETVVFFEEVPYESLRGRLKAVRVGENRLPLGPEITILERDFHLSFPGIYEDPAQPEAVFLLPEQAESRQVVLYRSPRAGRLEDLRFDAAATLLDGFAGIDPVLHTCNGLWYLFVTDGCGRNDDNNLYLFVSDTISGPYRPHPASPIRAGLRGSRMAGRLIQRGQRLLRPAQDCAPRYGTSVVFYAVEELTPTRYSETELAELLPNPRGPRRQRLHTVSMHEHQLAVDSSMSTIT